MDKFLYLIVLGGKSPKSNIELHDVRWTVASRIEDTFDELKKSWFGSLNGLHIDSYKKINSIDGYKINLKKIENNHKKEISGPKKKYLWFVNIGGYDPSSMQEKHEFGLVAASTSFEAKNIAKSKWLKGLKKIHKDDISCLKRLSIIDDCKLIKNLNNWEIELIKEKSFVGEKLFPDWYGYMRIG